MAYVRLFVIHRILSSYELQDQELCGKGRTMTTFNRKYPARAQGKGARGIVDNDAVGAGVFSRGRPGSEKRGRRLGGDRMSRRVGLGRVFRQHISSIEATHLSSARWKQMCK